MRVHEKTSKAEMNIDQVIQEVEEDYFIGRNNELNFFQNYIQQHNPDYKIIHFFGEGGIGKTFLLNELGRIAIAHDIPFIYLNSQDFTQNTEGFITSLHTSLLVHLKYPIAESPLSSLHECLQLIYQYGKKIIIAVDTYEQLENLDRWIRNELIRKLPVHVCVILAGRKPLYGEWQESPAWRKITKQIRLRPFNFHETVNFLDKNGFTNEEIVKKTWEFTKGNPLLLTLATVTDSMDDQLLYTNKNSEILSILTKRWLNEVKNERLLSIVEAAALCYQFDQNCLSAILEQDIPYHKFNQLISLSFVRKTHKGWSIHELIRDAIQFELQQRDPERYEWISKQIIEFYYHRIIKQPNKDDIASFFYNLGDDVIRSVFFQDTTFDSSMYLEPVGEYNFHEVENLFQYLNENMSISKTDYYNPTTNSSIQFQASLEHNRRELELVGPEYIKKIGYNGTSLLKKKNGEVIGISVVVPVNEQTLPILAKEPVSRGYFGNLTEADLDYYNVPIEKTAGYFIRYQDYKDPTDNAARSFLLYSLFPLIFSGGKITASTPLKFFQELLYRFGFQPVPDAYHHDYSESEPTPTFLLDLSGPKFVPYFKQFLRGITKQNDLDIVTKAFSLTKRERDIIALILEDKPIIDIANELYIAEITVKKALSRIYQKASVKNRVQLVKRIMELI